MSENDDTYSTPGHGPVATGPLTFVLCLVLFLGGFWLMAASFDHDSGWMFGLGILASGLAFIIPTQLLKD